MAKLTPLAISRGSIHKQYKSCNTQHHKMLFSSSILDKVWMKMILQLLFCKTLVPFLHIIQPRQISNDLVVYGKKECTQYDNFSFWYVTGDVYVERWCSFLVNKTSHNEKFISWIIVWVKLKFILVIDVY